MSRNDYAIMAILKFAVMIHRISHWLGWNLGYVVSARDKQGTVWIGFKCVRCEKITGVHMAHLFPAPKPEEFS